MDSEESSIQNHLIEKGFSLTLLFFPSNMKL